MFVTSWSPKKEAWMGPLQRSSWSFCHLLDASLGLQYSQVFLVYNFNFNRSVHTHTYEFEAQEFSKSFVWKCGQNSVFYRHCETEGVERREIVKRQSQVRNPSLLYVPINQCCSQDSRKVGPPTNGLIILITAY